jgi:hypothetical protein
MKTLAIAAAILFALPALADEKPLDEFQVRPMPESVKARIAELRSHGDRFEKAIAAIERQWLLPAWSDCDHLGTFDQPAS